MSAEVELPDSGEITVGNPPIHEEAVDLVEMLLDWGATRILVHYNDSLDETTIDFESPLPGDEPQRASVLMKGGMITEATLRLGVLDEDAFDASPHNNPIQIRRLRRIVQRAAPPGGTVLVNFGDERYGPRPHVLINWQPGSTFTQDEMFIRRGPPEPFGVGDFMAFTKQVASEVREKFDGQFLPEEGDVAAKYIFPSKNRPDLIEPSDQMKSDIRLFYLDHSREYGWIWSRLQDMRRRWTRSDRREKEALLKISYIQSVLSVRIPWERAEETFVQFMEGKSINQAWEDTNHGLFNKKRWLMRGLSDDKVWPQAVDLLTEGKVDLAHDVLLSDATGVGDAKVPFTVANLGFTRKMCIDGNVSTLFQADQPESLNIEEYEGVCSDIREMFPELSDDLRSYELQWLLFDYQRAITDYDDPLNPPEDINPIANHDAWFRFSLGDINTVIRRANAATREAKRETAPGDVPPDTPPDQPVREPDVIRTQIGSPIDTRLGRE